MNHYRGDSSSANQSNRYITLVIVICIRLNLTISTILNAFKITVEIDRTIICTRSSCIF